MTQLSNLLNSSGLISLLALIGLIVLIAMGKVTADVGLPLIVALAGVHTGAALSNPAPVPTPAPVPPRPTPPVTPPTPPVA